MPWSALNRPAVRNGSSGHFWEQKALQLGRCPQLRLRLLHRAGARAPRQTGSMQNSPPASSHSGPRQAAAFLRKKVRLIRALTSNRVQLVEMRKRLLAQSRAHQKLGTAVVFEDIDTELKHRIDGIIKELEDRVTRAIESDDRLSETAGILRSITGIGPVASTMLIAEMPKIGTITGEQAAALTGLAPVAHDSGTLCGKRAITGGRRALRHVMF